MGDSRGLPLVVLLRDDVRSGSDDTVTRVLADAPNASVCRGSGWIAISATGAVAASRAERWEGLPGVVRVVAHSAPYRLASRQLFAATAPVRIGAEGYSSEVGGGSPIMTMAAPLPTLEDAEGFESSIARALQAGAAVLHAGELSSGDGDRSSLGAEELESLGEAAHAAGLGVCVEISDARQIPLAAAAADLLQVGARNMQNFELLRELGRAERPVLLQRGMGATLEEFLLAAEYILASGNGKVILCETAFKVAGGGSRPRFEINAIPVLKGLTHLPVIADPTHSTSHAHLVPAIARGAIAAGADGLCVELSDDGVDVASCLQLFEDAAPVAAVLGRTLSRRTRPATPPPAPVGPARRAAAGVAVKEPLDLLHVTDRTLGSTLGSILGADPTLDVVSQMRVSAPHPSWLRWMLQPEGDLLVRWTRYRIGNITLSRHVAYVDVGRVDASIVGRLEDERLNLGELFRSEVIDKFGFEFGSGGTAGELDLALRRGHADVRNLHPYQWRRYIAATGGRVGFLVVEALPSVLWRRLLHSAAERARLTAA